MLLMLTQLALKDEYKRAACQTVDRNHHYQGCVLLMDPPGDFQKLSIFPRHQSITKAESTTAKGNASCRYGQLDEQLDQTTALNRLPNRDTDHHLEQNKHNPCRTRTAVPRFSPGVSCVRMVNPHWLLKLLRTPSGNDLLHKIMHGVANSRRKSRLLVSSYSRIVAANNCWMLKQTRCEMLK
ncbi:uncharacterized protein LOC129754538 [Uranotaenia lowii]|uniref:uncharacterized protein LOC129754538 n=1 Tax=Uranotaenia lowii TaxID=190385 RepID=UPI00247846D2|nr:uncharacterized protein LOC129754538 [Uranotaenia lowii]